MSKGPVLLVLLDAFRWDYLDSEGTPYLWDLTDRGVYVQQLKPNFGFCERSEIFTGTRPAENGYFTAWGYNPSCSPFSRYKWELKLWHLIVRLFDNKYTWYALRHYLQRRGCSAPIHKIPPALAPMFALTEDARVHWQKGGFSVESIFDILLAQRMSLSYEAFTSLRLSNGGDEDRINLLLSCAHEQHRLFLLYLGSVDSVCHRHGVGSTEALSTLRRIDSWVARIHTEFLVHHKNLSLVLVGDHGMTNAETYLDVRFKLRDSPQMANIKHGRDYLMFLDSTMARFWFKSAQAESAIRDVISTSSFTDNGQVLTRRLAQRLHVPSPSSQYGDLIWWTNPGVVIYPDYFHTYRPVKAMHGYRPDHKTAKGMAIVLPSEGEAREITEADLIDVCPTLCDLLEIRYPSSNQGQSFL